MKYWFIFLITALTFVAVAQPYAGSEKVKIKVSNSLKGANCTPPTTTTYMEINNVRAMVHTAGNLWQVPNQNFSMYEVPKNSGIMVKTDYSLFLLEKERDKISNELKGWDTEEYVNHNDECD
jgi:hypothetical protein